MAIKRFGDYENTQAYSDYQQLPKGGYVLKIMGAEVVEGQYGQYTVINCDIVEGEYKDYYANDYRNQKTEDKNWRCNYLLYTPKDDGTEQDGWTKRRFKTVIEALEESNSGYHFDWDEKKFKGKLIGGLFNEREYEKDGNVRRAINLAQLCTVEKIRSGNYKIPDDKLLSGNSGNVGNNSGSDNPFTGDGFMNVPAGTNEELPFN